MKAMNIKRLKRHCVKQVLPFRVSNSIDRSLNFVKDAPVIDAGRLF
jgi:hypothetical protein